MHYADSIGLAKIASSLKLMGVSPASLLLECIAANQTLAKYWKTNGTRILAQAQWKAKL